MDKSGLGFYIDKALDYTAFKKLPDQEKDEALKLASKAFGLTEETLKKIILAETAKEVSDLENNELTEVLTTTAEKEL